MHRHGARDYGPNLSKLKGSSPLIGYATVQECFCPYRSVLTVPLLILYSLNLLLVLSHPSKSETSFKVSLQSYYLSRLACLNPMVTGYLSFATESLA
jgi:hypothetical protein